MSSYFDYQSRRTRPREQVREDIEPVAAEPMLADEPMEVEESDPGQTWIGKMFRWPKGTP